MKQPVAFQYLPLNARFTHPGMEGEYVKCAGNAASYRYMTCVFMPDEMVIVDFPPIATCKDAPPAEPDPMDYFDNGELDHEAHDQACHYWWSDMQQWWETAGRKFLEVELTWQNRERELAAA